MAAVATSSTAYTDDEFAKLLTDNIRFVHYMTRKLHTPPYDDPEELAQTAMLIAWQRRKSFDPSRPTRTGRPAFRTFLRLVVMRVAQLACEKRVRRRRKEGTRLANPRTVQLRGDFADENEAEVVPARTPPPDAIAEQAEVFAAVELAISRLPVKQREAVEARLRRVKLREIDPTVSKEAARQRFANGVRQLHADLVTSFGLG